MTDTQMRSFMQAFFERYYQKLEREGDGIALLRPLEESDRAMCRAGEQIRAHEFHYAASSDAGMDFDAKKPNGRAWACVHASDTLYAGFPHLYFRANPAFAKNFVRRCAQKG